MGGGQEEEEKKDRPAQRNSKRGPRPLGGLGEIKVFKSKYQQVDQWVCIEATLDCMITAAETTAMLSITIRVNR